MRFWWVQSYSDPLKQYKVSQRADGAYACSCPHWIYRRAQCKHIQEVMLGSRLAIEVANPLMVKMLTLLGGWCEGVELKTITLNEEMFDDVWTQILGMKTGGLVELKDWNRLEGEFNATEAFWRRKK